MSWVAYFDKTGYQWFTGAGLHRAVFSAEKRWDWEQGTRVKRRGGGRSYRIKLLVVGLLLSVPPQQLLDRDLHPDPRVHLQLILMKSTVCHSLSNLLLKQTKPVVHSSPPSPCSSSKAPQSISYTSQLILFPVNWNRSMKCRFILINCWKIVF